MCRYDFSSCIRGSWCNVSAKPPIFVLATCGEQFHLQKQDQRVTVLIPELALESRIRYSGAVDLNEELKLALRDVDVPDLSARFRVLC